LSLRIVILAASGRADKEEETMDQPMITRRKALAAAGAAAGVLGAGAALTGVRSVQAASGASGDAVVGTWDVQVTSAVSGAPPFTSLVAFAAGGTLVTTDSQAQGDVSIGAWEREGGDGFRAVFESFTFDPTGAFVGTAIIHPKGSVDGDDVHGTFTVDFRPASGPTQHDVDHGTFTGSRMAP
jgi:hypothetical protein